MILPESNFSSAYSWFVGQHATKTKSDALDAHSWVLGSIPPISKIMLLSYTSIQLAGSDMMGNGRRHL